MIPRPYDAAKDGDAIRRIWREVGCSDGSPERAQVQDLVVSHEHALVGELAGPPELLQALDDALQLPRPVVGWEF